VANLTFQDARLRLLAYVRDQVRNGEFTERGFARLIGISQPHAHNVLKGVRNLSPEIFDLALKNLHLSLLDLVPLDEIEAQLQQRTHERAVEVPYLESPIGPGEPWPSGVNQRKTFPLPFSSSSFSSSNAPEGLVMARLVSDPAMPATLASYDIALLDTSTERRSATSPEGLYVIERNGEAVMRYLRSGARCYYLLTDHDFDSPSAWEPLALSEIRGKDAIKARIVWLGRERDRDALAQRGRLLYDPISS
jgi:hypothetical protein